MRTTIFLQGCKIKDQVASGNKKLVACAIRYVTYLKTGLFAAHLGLPFPCDLVQKLVGEMDSHVKGDGTLFVPLRSLHLVAFRGKKVLGHTWIGSL